MKTATASRSCAFTATTSRSISSLIRSSPGLVGYCAGTPRHGPCRCAGSPAPEGRGHGIGTPPRQNRPPHMDPLGFEADEADFNITLPTIDDKSSCLGTITSITSMTGRLPRCSQHETPGESGGPSRCRGAGVCPFPMSIVLSYLTLWVQRSSSQAQLPG